MFGNDRTGMRQVFVAAWRRHLAGEPLDTLQAQLADIIAMHPEYHALLEDPDCAVNADYPPESGQANPFLHLALHQAVREQLGTDRPRGIAAAFRAVAAHRASPHEAEHSVIDCLAEALWRAQSAGCAPDEAAYLDAVRRLAGP